MFQDIKLCAFDIIVLTAPNIVISEAYKHQLSLLKQQVPLLKSCSLFCAHDPIGKRIGSGGGTLRALSSVLKELSSTSSNFSLSNKRILIIHSGGDSQRAPLYSVCGKAWMSLPLNDDNFFCTVTNPLVKLIEQLNRMFSDRLPQGSCIVACSDVMLSLAFAEDSEESKKFELSEDTVYLVTVEAPITTAKNHGVVKNFSLQSSLEGEFKAKDFQGKQKQEIRRYHIADVDLYLQKPAISDMCDHGVVIRLQQDSALVDTGVVVFVGAAFRSLLSLLESPLCEPEMAKYQRFELYGELLLACGTSAICGKEINTQESFLSRIGSSTAVSPESSSELLSLWRAFASYKMKLIFVNKGSFAHLGTVNEVHRHLVESYYPNDHLRRAPSHRIALMQSFLAAVAAREEPVLENPSDRSQLIVDHCFVLLNSEETQARLPESGILSNIQPSLFQHFDMLENFVYYQEQLNLALMIEGKQVIQTMIDGHPDANFTVLVALHFLDDVKMQFNHSNATVFGLSWERFFKSFNCEASDIWQDSEDNKSLWTAKIFPVLVRRDPSHSICYIDKSSSAICPFEASQRVFSSASYINGFKGAMRMSLQEILRFGWATGTFAWRLLLSVSSRSILLDSERNDYASVGRPSTSKSASIGTAAALHGYLLESVYDLWRSWDRMFAAASADSRVNGIDSSSVLPALSESQRAAELIFHAILGMFRFRENEMTTSTATPGMCSHSLDPQTNSMQELLRSTCTQLEAGVPSLWRSNHRITDITSITEIADFDLGVFKTLLWEFLKARVVDELDLLDVCARLLEAGVGIEASEMPRLLFLLSWLMKDSSLCVERTGDASNLSCYDPTITSVDAQVLSCSVNIMSALSQVISKVNSRRVGVTLEGQTEGTAVDTEVNRETLSLYFETAAQYMVRQHIEISLQWQIGKGTFGSLHSSSPNLSTAIVAKAPVRIDLAGGWSDTPPICYEQSGAVLNVAILVDNRRPLRCASKFIKAHHLHFQIWKRGNSKTEEGSASDRPSLAGLELLHEEVCADWAELHKVTHSDSPCSLLKACVLVIAPELSYESTRNKASLPEYLESTFAGGLAVACISELPAGSGMGGSSILAATILKSLAVLLRRQEEVSCDLLVYMVSQVEQLLTTGGGWQDQVGGLFGGFKIARSPGRLPLDVNVESIPVPRELVDEFERRTFLLYTGQQRLAKNTLINALLRYSVICESEAPPADRSSHSSSRDEGIREGRREGEGGEGLIGRVSALRHTVSHLVANAESGANILKQCNACTPQRTLDSLAVVLNNYWSQKISMAPGSDPPFIRQLIDAIRPLTVGISLCGAGAGGFAVVILREEVTIDTLRMTAQRWREMYSEVDGVELSLHEVTVDREGIYAEETELLSDDAIHHLLQD